MTNLIPLLTKQYVLDRIKVNDTTGCWEWQRSIKSTGPGYGQLGYAPYSAHRLAFILWKGDPGKLLVRHQCETPHCCNPDHLLSGTDYDNWHDSAEMHLALIAKRRGRAANNRIAVTVNGVRYESKVAAMRALRVGPLRLSEMLAA